MEPTQELITWIIVVVLTNLATIITSIFTWIRSSKMMPKELKATDLDNMGKEASVAGQFNDIATKAAEQAVNLQSKLMQIEQSYNDLKDAYDELNDRVANQEAIIQEQAKIIEHSNIRLNEQETRMSEQDEIINELKFDLNVAQQYNSELISQMRLKNLIPIEPPKRKYVKHQKQEPES